MDKYEDYTEITVRFNKKMKAKRLENSMSESKTATEHLAIDYEKTAIERMARRMASEAVSKYEDLYEVRFPELNKLEDIISGSIFPELYSTYKENVRLKEELGESKNTNCSLLLALEAVERMND